MVGITGNNSPAHALEEERSKRVQGTTENKCQNLHRLRRRIVEELSILKGNLQETQLEGFDNPIETATIIKSLQETLHHVDAQLEKCPPED